MSESAALGTSDRAVPGPVPSQADGRRADEQVTARFPAAGTRGSDGEAIVTTGCADRAHDEMGPL